MNKFNWMIPETALSKEAEEFAAKIKAGEYVYDGYHSPQKAKSSPSKWLGPCPSDPSQIRGVWRKT